MMNLSRPKFLRALTVAAGALPLVGFLSVTSACERCEKWGPFYKETKSAMTAMDRAMAQADGTLVGDPDRGFIALMIPHHQGAIDMAKAVLLNGTDPALKNIAQESIAEQSIEIEYLQKIQARLTAAAPEATTRMEPASDDRFIANEKPAPGQAEDKPQPTKERRQASCPCRP